MPTEPSSRGFARLLWRLADLVQVAETRRSFRAKAYRAAVWALDDLPSLDAPDDVVLGVPGIGPGILSLIGEYRHSGHLSQLIPLEQAYPAQAARLRRLPRMTPRILRDLKGELGIETPGDLVDAIESGAALTIRGVGAQTLDLWVEVLSLLRDDFSAPAHRAWVMASEMASHVTRHIHAEVAIAGEVRRVEEWVTRLDLVVVTQGRPAAARFLDSSAALESVAAASDLRVEAIGHGGIPLAFHLAGPDAAGSVMVAATGPPAHAALFADLPPAKSEGDAYSQAALPWIPPPARSLPIEQAVGVVTVGDLRGDLHLHSDGSPDGRMTIETILETATARGYEYVLITDHTRGLRFGGLTEDDLAAQSGMIEALRPRYPDLVVFHGAELNIERDGTLDIDDEALSQLDFAVAGVHSHFGLEEGEQTERVLAALRHPKVRVLAHPFGRRIGIRPPLDIDMERVVEEAVTNGVALESNGHRDRLDLPAEWVRRAVDLGAIFAANSDAHRVPEMANIANAVGTLQRAGVTSDRVINAASVDDLRAWIGSAGSAGRG
ncbi:MAG TPA: PHP domain-containing protein [Acidimicrobiia bacterium]|nr:PHP domain-containing protein [Acidimicrobiia bacterium]